MKLSSENLYLTRMLTFVKYQIATIYPLSVKSLGNTRISYSMGKIYYFICSYKNDDTLERESKRVYEADETDTEIGFINQVTSTQEQFLIDKGLNYENKDSISL